MKVTLFAYVLVYMYFVCIGCDIEGYDYNVKFHNHTPLTLIFFIKDTDTSLEKRDFEIIMEGSRRNDSSYFCAETVNPQSYRTLDSYCYSNAWPMKRQKQKLIVFVFNKRSLLQLHNQDFDGIRRAQLKTLVLSYDEVKKNNYIIDFY